ncbi:LacI family DNA-binding transcriptional regulator [Rathayibacter sp. KR2-224]|uniref:LacI family DNA-binding transcriptional regulator n=1 Tax=Rathayibacter sp. KR2-224 TaxID=3400913 RepID=UPI003BFDCC64
MAATLRDVARLAGVSFRTVSNVVNGYKYVSEATRTKVEAAIAELDYQPNYSARSLRLGRSNLLGLAVPTLTQGYFAELASEIIDIARDRGYTVLTEQTNSTRALELDALQGARRQMTDGLLINPLALTSEDARVFATERPVVLLGENVFSPEVDHVTMRNVEAAQAGTEYLIDLGHRRIALIGRTDAAGPALGTSVLRVEGYRRGLQTRGIDRDPELELPTGAWAYEDGGSAVRSLLDRGIEFDAVFAVTDVLAIGALHELQASGLDVPGDVSVLGFDDLVESRYTTPSLSTIDGGRRRIADIAVDVLLNRIESPRAPVAFREVDFELIPRGSTGSRP